MQDSKTQGKSKQSWSLHAAIQYHLPKGLIQFLIFLPLAITLLLSGFSLPIFLDLHPYLWGEGKIVETTQFITFLFASILNIFVSWRATVLGGKKHVRIFYLVLGAGMFFIAGEEIAWGQQYLHFNIPEILRPLNVQNELTLHNIGILQARSDLLNLLFAVFGLLGIVFTIRGKIHRIKVPSPLYSWFVLIFALAVFGIWFKTYLGDRPLNYPDEYIFHIQTETTELLIALAGFLYPWFNFRESFSPVSLLLKKRPDTNLVLPSLFPINKGYAFITLITGMLCMLWFAVIPGEAANAICFGLSWTRLVFLTIGMIILVALISILIRATRDQAWRRNTSNRLNLLLCKSWIMWALTLLSAFILLSSVIVLTLTYTHNDPYLIGILTRLTPWFLWSMVLSLATLSLTIPLLLPLARYQLQKSKKS